MNYTEFAQAYSPEHSNVRLSHGLSQEEIEWGHSFGRVLYSHLTNLPEDENSARFVQDYADWTTKSVVPWYTDLINNRMPQGLDTHAHMFHVINANMLEQWGRLPDNPTERSYTISHEQNSLALLGLRLYDTRGRLFNEAARSGVANPLVADMEGILNELDSGLVLLEIQKRNLDIKHVVPAPYQFESSTPATNADFIMLTDDQAVGVQVKCRVTQDHLAGYDRDRIVLLDGTVDMGNQLAKKIPGQSRLQRIGWAGILCAQRIDKLTTYGQQDVFHGMSPALRTEQLRIKFLARQLVRGIRPVFGQAVDRVEPRVLHGLRSDSPSRTLAQ